MSYNIFPSELTTLSVRVLLYFGIYAVASPIWTTLAMHVRPARYVFVFVKGMSLLLQSMISTCPVARVVFVILIESWTAPCPVRVCHWDAVIASVSGVHMRGCLSGFCYFA